MLLGVRQAEALGLVAGDDITVTFPETGDVTLTVAGTFERDAIVGSAYVVSARTTSPPTSPPGSTRRSW